MMEWLNIGNNNLKGWLFTKIVKVFLEEAAGGWKPTANRASLMVVVPRRDFM